MYITERYLIKCFFDENNDKDWEILYQALKHFHVENLSYDDFRKWGTQEVLIAFDLQSNNPQREAVLDTMFSLPGMDFVSCSDPPPSKEKLRRRMAAPYQITKTVSGMVFSEEEKDAAPWLSLLSEQSVHVYNYVTFEKFRCSESLRPHDKFRGAHLLQVEPLRTTKIVRWKAHHGFRRIGIPGAMFCCSARAKAVIEKERLGGISFAPVYYKKETEPLDDIFQMVPTVTLSDKALTAQVLDEEYRCSQCGMRMIERGRNIPWQLRAEEIPSEIDFAYTAPMVGDCGMYLFLISAHAYRVFKENDLSRGLFVEPIMYTDKPL